MSSLFDCSDKKKVIKYHNTGKTANRGIFGNVVVLEAELECGHRLDFPTTGVLFECLECKECKKKMI